VNLRSALFLSVLLAAASRAGAQVPAPPAAPIPALNPNDYADEKNWLCRPGREGDACDVDLTTTVVAADGTLTLRTRHDDGKDAAVSKWKKG
jgi:hypothetical protein